MRSMGGRPATTAAICTAAIAVISRGSAPSHAAISSSVSIQATPLRAPPTATPPRTTPRATCAGRGSCSAPICISSLIGGRAPGRHFARRPVGHASAARVLRSDMHALACGCDPPHRRLRRRGIAPGRAALRRRARARPASLRPVRGHPRPPSREAHVARGPGAPPGAVHRGPPRRAGCGAARRRGRPDAVRARPHQRGRRAAARPRRDRYLPGRAGPARRGAAAGAGAPMSTPQTRYAESGDTSIAYQVVGDGPIDVVLVLGFTTHLELQWEAPVFARFFERISSFARLILFDKRGTGLSDPVTEVPTLEQRVDDVRAVMDAAGSERAVLFGVSEGAPMSALFAATHPERVSALVLYGAMARTTEAPDYPWASPAEALREAADEFIAPIWGRNAEGMLEIFAPSLLEDPDAVAFMARHERFSASPRMVTQIFEMFLDVDVRAILPTIHVPTLVLHRRGDRVVNRRAGEYLASQIPGAGYVELPGIDHVPWAGDSEAVLGEVEEFLTGARSAPEADRVLATVMFTDIVGSTQRAAELGDARWREVLAGHQTAVRRELGRFRGSEVKTLGDGVLATFDGPARAIRCGCAIAAAAGSHGLEMRVGLHSGEVELLDADVGGIAVHIAARIGALAGAGEVLVSSTVKDLVAGSGITFVDRGATQLRGIPDEWRLFAARP